MASEELNILSNYRKYTRRLITEIYNDRNNFTTLSEIEKASKRSTLKRYSEKINIENSKYQSLKFATDFVAAEFDTELQRCEEYAQKISECLCLLDVNSSSNVQNQNFRSTAQSLLRSPVAPLPKFLSNDGENLLKFIKEFEDTIFKFSYSEYDKLLLLRQQVSGRASILLESIDTSRHDYNYAKKLLIDALASPEIQKENVIKQLISLKLDYSDEPFQFISQLNFVIESVTKLNLNIDDIIRYFAWKNLNPTFQNQFRTVTNENRPTLVNIKEKFFEVCDRYLDQQKRSKFKKKVDTKNIDVAENSFAAKVNFDNKKKHCVLCSNEKDNDHLIHKCPKFSSPESKISQIKLLNGCVRCGYTNHTSDNCKYKFNSNCFNCKSRHMSFLCDKKESYESSSIKKPEKKIQSKKESPRNDCPTLSTSGNTFTEVYQCNIKGNSILPTFSCKVNNTLIRGLKDNGCQSNFVTDSLARKLNFKVLEENVPITINTINDTKSIVTKLVEAFFKFGESERKLKALCLPSININLNLKGLPIVTGAFVDKGFKLADEYLFDKLDYISNIEFILGTTSGYCIPETEILFGKDNCSLFSNTPVGVLLKGDITRLLQDLPFLPFNQNFNFLNSNVKCIENFNAEGLGVEMDTKVSYADCCDGVIEDINVNLESKINKATSEILDEQSKFVLNIENVTKDNVTSEINNNLVKFALSNCTREDNGRIKMPLLWNSSNSHLLGKNFNLSKVILQSNFKKFKKNKDLINVVDQTFKEQESLGIIEKIENLNEFLSEHPECSFLPHMSVLKPDRDTTRCRVVFLSNLCEKNKSLPVTLSHNQTIHSGPCLNQKLLTTLTHMRFDKFILCFDIRKAFNMISLLERDANKLLFLWYKNVERKDYSLIGYRSNRLPFGIRCAPALLMLSLYKLLVLDSEADCENVVKVKRLIYQLCYMDNLAVTAESEEQLWSAFMMLEDIFGPYQFNLQQFIVNINDFQVKIDEINEESTEIETKLFGLKYNRLTDKIFTKPLNLSSQANTKRKILASIASNFDLLNINCPILNRAKLFMHSLQCQKNLNWDEILSSKQINEWKNISRQVNSSPVIELDRYVGQRNGKYKLILFSDSSKSFYGTVVYLKEIESNKVSFLMAKNKVISKNLEDKSIPSLELLGLSLASECAIDVYKELSGPLNVCPIDISKIEIYSDSFVAISWLKNHVIKFDKMNKKSVFVMNRLSDIVRNCEIFPMNFSFVSGLENPADFVTRNISYKLLIKSNYLTGPRFIRENDTEHCENVWVRVPNPHVEAENPHVKTENLESNIFVINHDESSVGLIDITRFSSFTKLVRVVVHVLSFVNKIKKLTFYSDKSKFSNLNFNDCMFDYSNEAVKIILRLDQQKYFKDIFDYFCDMTVKLKSIPNLVNQLNLFVDDGILKVKSKCEKLKLSSFRNRDFPILLSKDSFLTKLIILDTHAKLLHSGKYSLLNEIRKKFYIQNGFSVVKKTLKDCVVCKRANERCLKLNQSSYRLERLDPINIPFSQIYIDYLGPFNVKTNNTKTKVWLLCFTCMWTRGINLKICSTLTVTDFLRSFQIHVFEFGLPQFCFSDLGSQIVAGGNLIQDFLHDPETILEFQNKGIHPISFEQFYKGHSELGSLVETMVKQTKRLMFSSIKKNVLNLQDFEFLVIKTTHLINRRPIAYKEALRDLPITEVPIPITPEFLMKGYHLESINVVPQFKSDDEWTPVSDLIPNIRSTHDKLIKVRNNLIKEYNETFLSNLIYQSIDRKDRYKPVLNKSISPGDIVLIKDNFTKFYDYPLARVINVVKNDNGEVTGATLRKGSTRELVKRHSSCIIPLMSADFETVIDSEEFEDIQSPRIQRKSAGIAMGKIHAINDD